MRKIAVALALILLVLSAFAVTADSILPAYSDTAQTILPKAIVAIAALLVVTLLAYRPEAPSGPTTEVSKPAAPPPAPVTAANQFDAEVVNFLSILQERGRFVDFLMDDIAGYSDAQVGAAGRVLHEGCKAVLREHFGVRPMREEEEGSTVTVPTGYAPDDYRLVGKISGEAPFTGTLVHHGWKVDWVKLPRVARIGADKLPAISPAEVELR
ncbi:MAG: DUF2760 domain-containing protein [Xanthobacteraceae bacterium]